MALFKKKRKIPHKDNVTQDVLWALQPDGTGTMLLRGNLAGNLKAGEKVMIKSGAWLLERITLKHRDQLELDGGTAIRRVNGSIQHSDDSIIEE